MTDTSNSRRDFIKTSAVASLVPLALSRAVHGGVDDTIKIGLVGCGGRGTGAAGQALKTEGKTKLVAVGDAFADRIEGSLKGLTNELGDSAKEKIAVDDARKFVGLEAFKQVIDSGVDLVILATPPGFRPMQYDYAVKAGKNIFMEKPVAVDAAGVRLVLEATKLAKEKKLKVGVGLQRHHQAPYIETIQRIHDGAIGNVTAIRAYWNQGLLWEPPLKRADATSEMHYQLKNWYYYNWLCGDHIVEQHIHNLDIGNWIKSPDPARINHPVRAFGMGGRQVRTDKRYGEIYDHHAVEFVYSDETRMYSQCRHINGCWNSVTEHAHGTKGMADVSGHRIQLYGGKWEKVGGKSTNPYQVEHDDLFAAIRAGKDYNEAENGAISSMIAIMGRMATYSGTEVNWDDALASNVTLSPSSLAWDANPPSMPNENGEYAIAIPGQTKVL